MVARVQTFKWTLGVFHCGGGGGGKRRGIFNAMSGRRWIKFRHIGVSRSVRIKKTPEKAGLNGGNRGRPWSESIV